MFTEGRVGAILSKFKVSFQFTPSCMKRTVIFNNLLSCKNWRVVPQAVGKITTNMSLFLQNAFERFKNCTRTVVKAILQLLWSSKEDFLTSDWSAALLKVIL